MRVPTTAFRLCIPVLLAMVCTRAAVHPAAIGDMPAANWAVPAVLQFLVLLLIAKGLTPGTQRKWEERAGGLAWWLLMYMFALATTTIRISPVPTPVVAGVVFLFGVGVTARETAGTWLVAVAVQALVVAAVAAAVGASLASELAVTATTLGALAVGASAAIRWFPKSDREMGSPRT